MNSTGIQYAENGSLALIFHFANQQNKLLEKHIHTLFIMFVSAPISPRICTIFGKPCHTAIKMAVSPCYSSVNSVFIFFLFLYLFFFHFTEMTMSPWYDDDDHHRYYYSNDNPI